MQGSDDPSGHSRHFSADFRRFFGQMQGSDDPSGRSHPFFRRFSPISADFRRFWLVGITNTCLWRAVVGALFPSFHTIPDFYIPKCQQRQFWQKSRQNANRADCGRDIQAKSRPEELFWAVRNHTKPNRCFQICCAEVFLLAILHKFTLGIWGLSGQSKAPLSWFLRFFCVSAHTADVGS